MALVSAFSPVAVTGAAEDSSRILAEYADFWKIPYTQKIPDRQNSVVFTSDRTTAFQTRIGGSAILTPTGREEAEKAALDAGGTVRVESRLLRLPVRKGSTVSLTSEFYSFSGAGLEPVLMSDGVPLLSRVRGKGIHLLGVDLVTRYSQILHDGFEDSPNWKFSLVTRLPFSYQSIPSFLRNRSFRSQTGVSLLREENLGPVECLRAIFLASLVKCAGPVARIGFWRRGKSYAFSASHDVETQEGLERGAQSLIDVEEKMRIRSTWNIPSDRYPLTPSAVTTLRDKGEIGAHDTKHDGRLALLSREEKTQRLTRCLTRLQELTGQRVRGFRAPLLQHSADMAYAASQAGYEYDSSSPSWEILSPTSLRPHGVGTIFPFTSHNILEIPVTLPQDHQLIRVAGQTPSAAVDLLLRLSAWIRSVGGACILLTHPDYEFAMPENKREYERLLENFRSDPECDIMTLGELSDWWRLRQQARIELQNDRPTIITPEPMKGSTSLHGELVTDYGEDGFTTVSLS